MDKKNIFRPSYKTNVNSPDELNKFLHTTSPKVWVFLSLIGIFLILFILWSIFGTIPNVIECGCQVDKDNSSYIYINTSEAAYVQPGMKVDIDGKSYIIASLEPNAVKQDGSIDNLALYYSHIGSDDAFYCAKISPAVSSPGIYKALVHITSDIPPYKILFN